MEEDASSLVSSQARCVSEDDGVGRVSGSIDLRFAATVADLTDHVHLLPCSIKHDGPCPVRHYFKPMKTDMSVVGGLSVKEACFRGRKLEGVTISLPQGYRGYVLGKKMERGKSSGDQEAESSHWVSRAQFGNLTCWNHDSLPSKDDPLMRCFHLFSVSNVLHRPVTAEEMASASSYQGNKGGRLDASEPAAAVENGDHVMLKTP